MVTKPVTRTRARIPQQPRWPQVAILAGLVVALGLLSGCLDRVSLPFSLKSAEAVKVQEPPYVPAWPEGSSLPDDAPLEPLDQFADMLDRDVLSEYDPRLADAVARAIRIGVLRPAAASELFDPGGSLTYETFRAWVLVYQNPLLLAGEEARKTMQAPPLIEPSEQLALPGAPALVQGSDVLTRQAWCLAMAVLNGADAQVKALDEQQVREAVPPDAAPTDTEEQFGQFKDYAQVSSWARPYVAWAYRQGLLKDTFGLTTNQLTLGAGFEPLRPMRRAEVMVTLDVLYGETALQAMPKPAGTDAQPEAAVADTLEQEPKRGHGVQPVGRIQETREHGPRGSRTTLQVQGPDS